MPELHIVAGPNGSGKTTMFYKLVPAGVQYLNADLIAKAIKEKAGGLNVQDIANAETSKIFFDKVANRESFAIETNLADADTYKSFQSLRGQGYSIRIYFLAVDNPLICIDRVKVRVAQGGHNVNPDVIKQRYFSGLALLKHYKSFPDTLLLLDNTDGIVSTQAELSNGAIKYQTENPKSWVKEVLAIRTKQSTVGEKNSIDEVRKHYKDKGGGPGL